MPVERIVVGGGGARSALWREIQASVYGRPVETSATDEGAALGAAILAGVGAGVWTTVDDAVDATVRRGGTTPQEADAVALMNDRYAHYRRMYPALRAIAGAAFLCVAQGFSPAFLAALKGCATSVITHV